MKVSLNWLAEFVDLSGLTPEKIGQTLTMVGLELEEIEQVGEAYSVIRVGEIQEIAPHPDAEKLVLCQVRIDADAVQIVCGASNMKEGDKVPVVSAGKRLPDGSKIKRSKIRGEISNGMLCSRKELGLGEDHDGLMILDGDAPVGEEIGKYLKLSDTVLDFAVTPNRGDTLSHLGVAREIAAITGRPYGFPSEHEGDWSISGSSPTASEQVSVEISDQQGCARYAAAVMRDVVVGPSPLWLKQRMEAIGQRSVNNLVDVTNYVMMETGQPLHAFDLDRLAPSPTGELQLVVRRAVEGEEIRTLDHVDRVLRNEDLVIADQNGPVAIAGVMGGLDSEVTEATQNLVLECAYFNPQRIRRTARRLGLNSEASYRFERTVDINGIPRALTRLVELILRTQSGGSPVVGDGMVDVYPKPFQPTRLTLRPGRCNGLMGFNISTDQMKAYLSSLGAVVEDDGENLSVLIPSFRSDLEREVDLIEEIGRLYGFDQVAEQQPVAALGFEHQLRDKASDKSSTIVDNETLEKIERLRDRLAGMGILEAINYTFIGLKPFEFLRLNKEDPRRQIVEIANPLSESWKFMRTTLLPGMLNNISSNLAHQAQTIALFELGSVFREDSSVSDTGVKQGTNLALVLCGNRQERWLEEVGQYNAFDVKAVLDAVAHEFKLSLELGPCHDTDRPFLHPGVSASITLEGERVGCLGQLHPRVGRDFEIEVPAYLFELDLEILLGASGGVTCFKPVPKYPSATRDLAMVVPSDLPYGELLTAINAASSKFVESVQLSSVYEGEPIPAGNKSIAVAVTYRSPKGSLTVEKVDSLQARLAEQIVKDLGAELR